MHYLNCLFKMRKSSNIFCTIGEFELSETISSYFYEIGDQDSLLMSPNLLFRKNMRYYLIQSYIANYVKSQLLF